MSEQDIDKAIEIVLKNKALRAELDIDKSKAYDLRNRSSISVKLEILYHAKAITLKDEFIKQ